MSEKLGTKVDQSAAVVYVKRTNAEIPWRRLTPGEIKNAKLVFHDRIDYSLIEIVKGKCCPPIQDIDTPMSPDGNVYWPKAPDDASIINEKMYTLIHELTHVYQFQSGIDVLAEAGCLQVLRFGSAKFYDPYSYKKGKTFSDYNLEQQAVIASDIWAYISDKEYLADKRGMGNILIADSVENLRKHHLLRECDRSTNLDVLWMPA